ncbi:uncharacterized protein LOC124494242 [Dermatophagoides farinae]|uniref:LEM domain n=2 Tax=Dermatophagoides farinae TaxID=6954 RepID=A0A922HP51_DERFA|nr:uncharacterized protein LOC124494242 [Dermatophagoides farinae]KAH9493715.1 LEM domain [Dermatophagoides farinae]
MSSDIDQSMQIMEIVQSINQAISTANLAQFKSIIEPLGNDINQYIIVDDESDTQMNILHIIASREYHPMAIDNDNYRSDVFHKFIDIIHQYDQFDVDYRASIDGQYNMTAAHIAIQWQNLPMLEALIFYGADLLICDCNGQNVQDYARNIGNDQLFRLVKRSIYESIESRLEFSHPNLDNHHHYNDGDNGYYYAVPRPVARDDEDDYDDDVNCSLAPHSSSSTLAISSISGYQRSPSIGRQSSTNLSITPNHSSIIDRFNSNATFTSEANSETSLSFRSFQNLLNQAFYHHRNHSSQQIMTNNSDSNISENNLNQDENHREESSLMIINDNKSQKSNSANNNNYETITVVKESDVELVEQRFESVSSPLKLDISNESSASTESTGSNIDEFIMKMNDTQLRQELNRFGFEIVGPLNSHTRHCYQRKFHTLRKENEQQAQQNQQKQPQRQKQTEQDGEIQAKMANYHIEFDLIRSRKFPFIEARRYEMQLIEQFSISTMNNDDSPEFSTLRNGKKKFTIKSDQTYFVYLLLDPSITKNLPAQVNLLLDDQTQSNDNPMEQFCTMINDYRLFYRFISAIFYVGKGKNDRPYQHFIDAHRERKQPTKLDIKPKIQRIWTIWDRGLGPISLNDCQGIKSDEAHAREALIIETIGLFNLTNQIAGSYRQQLQLNQRQKSILGTYLLYKFFIMYLCTGERQIRIP